MPDRKQNYAELQRCVADKRKARSAKPRPQLDPARRRNRKGSRPGFASQAARHVPLSGLRPLHNNIPGWLRMTAEELRAAAHAAHIDDRPARIRPHVAHDGGGGVFVAGDARVRPSFVVWAIREGREVAAALVRHRKSLPTNGKKDASQRSAKEGETRIGERTCD